MHYQISLFRANGGAKRDKAASNLAPPVLEPHLDDAHVEPRLGGQLFPYVPCWFRGRVEGILEYLQLLGLDSGPGSPSLAGCRADLEGGGVG